MPYYPLERDLTEILSIAAYLVAIMSLPAFAAVPAGDLFFAAVGTKRRHEAWWKAFRLFWASGVMASALFAALVFITAILQKNFEMEESHIRLCVNMLFPMATWLTVGFGTLVAIVLCYGVSFHFYYLGMDVVNLKRITGAADKDPMFTRGSEQKEVIYKVGERCQRSGYYLCIKGARRRAVGVVYVAKGDLFEGQSDEWFVFDRSGTREER